MNVKSEILAAAAAAWLKAELLWSSAARGADAEAASMAAEAAYQEWAKEAGV